MSGGNDESAGEETIVRNILEDLDTFVGGKKRKHSEGNNPETQVPDPKSATSISSRVGNEKKNIKGVKFYT